jgi:hypothetical protein
MWLCIHRAGQLSRYSDGLGGPSSISGRCKLFLSSTWGLGAPIFMSYVYQRLFPVGIKLPERKADRSPPSIAEVKSGGAVASLPTCFIGVVLI